MKGGFFRWADRLCRWVVSATVFGVLLTSTSQDEVAAAWYTFWCVGAAVGAKLLKRIVRQPRPAGTKLASSGMPSSHATSLWVIALSGSALLFRRSREWAVVAPRALPFAAPTSCLGVAAWLSFVAHTPGVWVLLAVATFFCVLRVTSGHHTVPQVLVGAALGTTFAVAAVWSDLDFVGDVNQLPRGAKDVLLVTLLASSVLLGARVCRRWIAEWSA